MASLADLYLRQGQQRAQTAVSLADIAANSQQQKAQTWGRAFATIGDIAGSIPGQLQQAKQLEQQGQMNQMRLDDAKAQREQSAQMAIDQKTVNEILANLSTSESGARTIPRERLQQQFAQANVPLELQAQTFKALDAVDGSLESFAKAKREHGAQFAKTVLSSGVDLNDPQALSLAVALAKGNGLIDDQFIDQFGQALQSGIHAQSILQQLAGPQEKKPLVSVGRESRLYDPNTNTTVLEAQPAEPKMYPVTVDDGRGRPVEKLFTADQLQQGVPAYHAPNKPDIEPLMAIMGPDNQPVYVPRSQAIGKRPANNREQGRPLTSGDANRIADLDTSLNDLKTMRAELSTVAGTTGTSAKVGAMLPNAVTDLTGWGTTAKQKQAVIDRVKQVIGKALEGGVLRKEDEIKYEKILPTIGDTAAVAKAKLDGLEAALKQRRETSLDAYEDAGYEVSRYRSRTPASQNIGRFQVVVE